MANMDFVSYPLGAYTMNNIKFGEGVKDTPKIFSNNYFMRGADGKFVTSKLAKKVWLHWAEGRIHGEYDAYETPTGKIPMYADLAMLFKKYLNEEFTEETYTYLFTFRCTKWIEKLERTKAFYAEDGRGDPRRNLRVLGRHHRQRSKPPEPSTATRSNPAYTKAVSAAGLLSDRYPSGPGRAQCAHPGFSDPRSIVRVHREAFRQADGRCKRLRNACFSLFQGLVLWCIYAIIRVNGLPMQQHSIGHACPGLQGGLKA